MPVGEKSKKEILAENVRLRKLLEEAEASLRAHGSAGVSSFMDTGPAGVHKEEGWHVQKNGTAEATTSIGDDYGKLRGFSGTIQDITECKQSSEAIRHVKEEWERTFDSVPDLIAILDNEHRIMRVNDSLAKRLGLQKEECIGIFCYEAVHGSTSPPDFCPHSRTIEDGREHTVEQHVDQFGGDFQITTNSLLDENGERIGSVHVAHDITERKRMEEALRKSEERLALALEGGQMGLWEWDPIRNRLVWNSIEYRLLGLPVGTGVESTEKFFDLVHPEDVGPFNQILSNMMKNGSDFQHELRIIRANDGHVSWLAVAGRLYRDAAGQPVKMVGVNYDITQRKLAVQALSQLNEELESRVVERTAELAANIEKLKIQTEERILAVDALREKEQILIQQSRLAAMGEMIGNIAHQWRQPLNTLGLTIQQQLFMYDIGEFTREFLENSVVKSMQLIQHMSQTIDDFRNYFRPDKEKVEFEVSEAVTNTLSLIEDSFRNEHIRIKFIAMNEPVITGYRNEYAQVILNILSNARDAFKERNIKEPEVSITIFTEGGRSAVTIADNAGGISEEIMGKIFDPYFTTKGPQQGTGVGLFMSKTIIESNMGGRLSVRNHGRGAEFRIEM